MLLRSPGTQAGRSLEVVGKGRPPVRYRIITVTYSRVRTCLDFHHRLLYSSFLCYLGMMRLPPLLDTILLLSRHMGLAII